METMAQQLEAIRRKQRPVSSEVFWQQVEAFKDQEVPTPESSTSSVPLTAGQKTGAGLLVANG